MHLLTECDVKRNKAIQENQFAVCSFGLGELLLLLFFKTWLHVEHTMKLAIKKTHLSSKTRLTCAAAVTWMLENPEIVGVNWEPADRPSISGSIN